jgi:truncated hemoglobin YjbI
MPLRDWLRHFAGPDAWSQVVLRFYARAAADPNIAGYFTRVDIDQLQRHFLAALMIVSGQGVTVGVVRRMHTAHAAVRNTTTGQPITDTTWNAGIGALAASSASWERHRPPWWRSPPPSRRSALPSSANRGYQPDERPPRPGRLRPAHTRPRRDRPPRRRRSPHLPQLRPALGPASNSAPQSARWTSSYAYTSQLEPIPMPASQRPCGPLAQLTAAASKPDDVLSARSI